MPRANSTRVQAEPDDAEFDVFHRTWWKESPGWPNGLEPCAGEKTYLAYGVSEETARELCQEYNNSHEPGRLSRKAEYEVS